MLHEVDAALRALLRADNIGGTDIEVVFDAPTKEWAARRNAPTVDVYLYDIREDVRCRRAGLVDFRDENGMVTARSPAPRVFKLSYLVTAWTQRPEDEHRLLSSVLACFLKQDKLPAAVLAGSLAEVRPIMPVSIAIPPPEDRALNDVWSALGGELKPSLDVVVTAPLVTGQAIDFGPPVLETPRVGVGDLSSGAEEAHQMGDPSQPGRVFRIRRMS